MPEISRFYGIVIVLYYRDHEPPHFHALYGGAEGIVRIDDGAVSGNLPGRARRMVLDWLEQHREELRANWARARARKSLARVAPLE